MAKLKLSENLFLEVAELNRFRQFIEDDGWKRVIKSIIKSYGIVQDEQNTYFKVTKQDNGNIIINPGLAFDSNLNAIVLNETLTREVVNPGANLPMWLILRRAVHNNEQGTVSVTADGTLVGVNTEFTKVLRGQPNFPTKIKFDSQVNTSEYEVVQVNSDSSAIIAGAVTAESGLKYSVMGTFTPGYTPADENKLIYEFDSCEIVSVVSAGVPTLNPDEYLIASLVWDELGILTVTDQRVSQMFNSDYSVNHQTAEGIDFMTSLVQASIVSGINAVNTVSADLELILEHGYTVTSQQLEISEAANMFIILSGSCNYLGSDMIPTNAVNGWLLVNRANMVSANIINNVYNTLYLESVPGDLLLESGNDFVVVPNFREIEYEVKLGSNVAMAAQPFVFRNSISNPFTRARVYATFPKYGGANTVNVKVRYRMIDNLGTIFPYKELALATFLNTQGNVEGPTQGQFTVNMKNIEPVANQRNYS